MLSGRFSVWARVLSDVLVALKNDPSVVWRGAAFLLRERSTSEFANAFWVYLRRERTVAANVRAKPGPLATMRNEVSRRGEEGVVDGPLLSVIVPVYNTPAAILEACIRSVVNQSYVKLQLIVVNDASTQLHVRPLLESLCGDDSRIVLVHRDRNGRISQATNDGIKRATGEFLLFLDHDDELAPDALAAVAAAIVDNLAIDVWYSDQLKCDERGNVFDHFFKPDWSPLYFLGVMYIGHLLAMRTTLVNALGGFASAYDGVQDFELMLRATERTQRIGHIAQALYKWRAVRNSVAAAPDAKTGIDRLQRQAVEAHLGRLGRTWQVTSHERLPHRLRIMSGPNSATPSISIIIPSRDQGPIVARCLESIFRITAYPDFEVIVVDNETTDPEALAAFERHQVKRIPYEGSFNYSDANNRGVANSCGEYLLFLNNDTEVLDANWLRTLVVYFEDEGIGAVGPILLYADRRI